MSEIAWVEKNVDEHVVMALKQELGISSLLARMLVARSIVHTKEAAEFLAPSLKSLQEPLSFADMDKAVKRIYQAIIAQETMGIFGDYDVDGVSSTALLAQFLTSVQARVVTTLPNRLHEGYGLSVVGIDRLRAQGASLIITADCGSLSHAQIDYANELGCDVIVVDHHNVSEILPNAYAVVNPKRADCASGAHYLCAAGVAFYLCMAVRRYLREQNYFTTCSEPDVRDLLDLVALATVCDVVPLVKDNRALVKAGLKSIKEQKRVGLSALMRACGIDPQKISSTNLGFHLGPRINAAGRLDDATEALKLFSSDNADAAFALALDLDTTNRERKLIEEQTVMHACTMIENDPTLKSAPALVLHDEQWHTGVVGIVASRIAERYHRPAIIIGAKGKGSGRSIKGIDLHEMVTHASSSLAGFGGHAHAIGVTLGEGGVIPFRNDLCAVIETKVDARVYGKQLVYDASVSIDELNLTLVDELSRLEPFGAANPYPVIRLNHCFVRNLRRLEGGHLKGELEHARGVVSFIGFRMDMSDELAHCALDVLGVPERNEWQGRVSVQVRLIDYKKSPSG